MHTSFFQTKNGHIKGLFLSLYLQDLTRYRDPLIWAHSLACGDFFFNSFPCGIFGVPPKTAIDAILASADAILFTSHETSDTFGAHHQNFPEMMTDFWTINSIIPVYLHEWLIFMAQVFWEIWPGPLDLSWFTFPIDSPNSATPQIYKSLFVFFMGESTNLSWWTPDSEPSTVDSLSPFQVTGAKRSHSVWICVANSRVGAKTKVMGVGVSGAVAVFSHLGGQQHQPWTLYMNVFLLQSNAKFTKTKKCDINNFATNWSLK